MTESHDPIGAGTYLGSQGGPRFLFWDESSQVDCVFHCAKCFSSIASLT